MSQTNASAEAETIASRTMPAEEAQAQMGKRIFNEKWTVPLLALTVMIVIMNTMMFNLALPSITMQFELTATVASWIVTGYSIVFAISSITYSRLSDFVPLRTLFTIGLLLLGLASLIGLFSSSFPVLLLARLLQASGAGSILSMSIILITRNVPEQRRGKAISFVISSSSLGFGLGPVLGGAIMQFWGWNDLFAVTALVLPLIPLYLILLPREKAGSGTFDAWGALLTGIGTTGLLLFLTTQRWEMLVIGLVAVGLFILRIRSASNPFVAPSLFGNRPYLSLAALGMASYMNNFAVLFLMPQILVHLFGLSSLQSGLIIFPGAILSMLAARSIGRIIDRQGNGVMLRFGPWLLTASAILLATLAVHAYIAILIIYIPLSLAVSALTAGVSNEMSVLLTGGEVGAGMGLFQLAQFFSGALTTAIIGTALVWMGSLPLSQAYTDIFWGMSLVSVLGVLSSFLYLRQRGGRRQRKAAAA